MCPYRQFLTAEEEIGIKFVGLNGHVSVNDILLLNDMVVSKWYRRRR